MVNRIIGIEVRERPMMSQIKIQTVKEAIEKLLSAKRDISMKAMDEVKLGLFTLETKDLKNELVKGAQLNLNYLMNVTLASSNRNSVTLSSTTSKRFEMSTMKCTRRLPLFPQLRLSSLS